MTRYDRYKMFKENAGWSVPPGRAACALNLVRAEELLDEAESLGIASSDVTYDFEPYDPGDMVTDEQAQAKFDSGEWTGPFGVVVTVDDETFSLWGIVVGPEGENDPYIRVVRAELADEAEDALRQAIGDAQDALLTI